MSNEQLYRTFLIVAIISFGLNILRMLSDFRNQPKRLKE